LLRITYRRSAEGARGSEATDKPVCCNAKLASSGSRLPVDGFPALMKDRDDGSKFAYN